MFDLFEQKEKSQTEKLIDQALLSYYKYRMIESAGDKLIDRFFTNKPEQESLEQQERQLNILARKRQLGMPTSDKDYERAVNSDQSFVSHSLPLFGKRTLQAIPNPKFFSPHREPYFKIAESISDALPSMKTSATNSLGGNRYARLFRSAAAVFSL